MEEPFRLRLVFEDRSILSESQRSQGLEQSWLRINSEISTIADLATHVFKNFNLERSCPHGVLLSLDDFVLPPFETTSVLSDKDIIRVRKKVVSQMDVSELGDDPHDIQDSPVLEKDHTVLNDRSLAVREFGEDSGRPNKEHTEDLCEHNENATHIGTPSKSKKKRKHSDEIQGSKKKKVKASSKKPSFTGDKNEDIDTPVTCQVEDTFEHVTKSVQREKRRKKSQLISPEKAIMTTQGADNIDTVENNHSCQKRDSSVNCLHKNHKQSDDGRFVAVIASRPDDCISEGGRNAQAEDDIEENTCEPNDCVKKVQRRNARRKKAKRQWLQSIKSQKGQNIENQSTPESPEPPEQQETEQYTETEKDIVPVIIRPGHIRFQPSGRFGSNGSTGCFGSNSSSAQGFQSDGDSTNTTVFVGGLDPNVTEYDLKQSFSQYGDIASVKIPVGKQYGFVQFVQRNNAEEAIQGLNGTVLGKQTIRLSWGRNPANKQTIQNQIPPKVIHREPPELQEAEQNTEVEKDFGPIAMRPGRIQFQPLGGSGSNVSSAQDVQSDGDSTNTTVFVGGLDPTVGVNELKQIFSQYGEIASVKIPAGKQYGFVQFVQRNNAKEALQGLNGTVIGKQTVRLSWGHNTANKQGTLQWNGTCSKKQGRQWGTEKTACKWNDSNGCKEQSNGKGKMWSNSDDANVYSETYNGKEKTMSKWNDANGYGGQSTYRDRTMKKWNDASGCTRQCNAEAISEKGKTKCTTIDFERLYPLTRIPQVGDLLAYRLIELSTSWCPEVSPFRVGQVTSYNYMTMSIILVPVPEFPLFPEDGIEGRDLTPQANPSPYNEDGSLQIHYPSLVDVRLLKASDSETSSSDNSEGEMITQKAAPMNNWEKAPLNNNARETGTQPTDNRNMGGSSWDQIKQTINEKKAELQRKKDGWEEWTPRKSNPGTSWSHPAFRRSAMGPTLSYMRGRDDNMHPPRRN